MTVGLKVLPSVFMAANMRREGDPVHGAFEATKHSFEHELTDKIQQICNKEHLAMRSPVVLQDILHELAYNGMCLQRKH
jgi:hypothetical protein